VQRIDQHGQDATGIDVQLRRRVRVDQDLAHLLWNAGSILEPTASPRIHQIEVKPDVVRVLREPELAALDDARLLAEPERKDEPMTIAD
jgi:hypothetical protein